MSTLVEEAIARCAAEPNRRDMVFSPSYRRSADLFRGQPPEGVSKLVQQHCWVFPNGSTLHFGHVTSEADTLHYSGDEWSKGYMDGYIHPQIEAFLKTRERL